MKIFIFALVLAIVGCHSDNPQKSKIAVKGKAGLEMLQLDDMGKAVLSDGSSWPVDVTDFHASADRFYVCPAWPGRAGS